MFICKSKIEKNLFHLNILYGSVGGQFGGPILVVQVLVQKIQHNEFL